MTREGVDYVVIDEGSIDSFDQTQKIHLIELAFETPTKALVDRVLSRYPLTNRYIISSRIQFYNSVLKKTGKKYYVANSIGDKLITFFRKNNKVLLDIDALTEDERTFVTGDALKDVVSNCEVIAASRETVDVIKDRLAGWRGNIIVRD